MVHLNVPERLKSHDVQTFSDCRHQLQQFLDVFCTMLASILYQLINLAHFRV